MTIYRLSLIIHAQVSLRLSPLPLFEKQPKEYNLLPSRRETLLPRRPRNAFVFSEKDMPGYKKRHVGPYDEEGSNYHGRSYLYEKNKRDSKRKESKKRFEPYTRKPIPKQTAIAGVVSHEFECAPVQNAEYKELETLKAKIMLKPKEEIETSFDNLKDAKYLAPGTIDMYGKTTTAKVSFLPFLKFPSRLTFSQQERKRREAAKENRASRLPKNELIDMLLDLFQYYKYWGLRELKKKTNQPDAYLREVLNDIATMWKSGDLSGKWELKPEFKERDAITNYAEGMAPEAVDSEADLGEDDDENETFEDV